MLAFQSCKETAIQICKATAIQYQHQVLISQDSDMGGII